MSVSLSRSARRARTALAVVAAVAVAAGCAQIPTSGPVQPGDVTVAEPGPIFLQVYGPALDASPQEIVQDFLSAQAAGLYEDWETAREYLAADTAASWEPGTSTVVYSGDTDLTQVSGPDPDATSVVTEPSDEGTDASTADPADEAESDVAVVRGRLSVVATLDAAGRFTEAPADAAENFTFSLEQQEDSQWRITGVEDVTYISVPIFSSVYRATTLYFPTLDGEYLVPEVRWYSKSNTATYAVNGLLAGPSEWLRDAVRTVAPDGTSLVLDAVTVDESGVARVDLTRDLLSTDAGDRAMLQAQFEAVLLRVPQVRSVNILVNSVPLTVDETAEPVRDPIPAASPWVLAGDVLSRVQGRAVEPVAGIAPLTDLDPTALALDVSGESGVLRSGQTSIRTLPTTADSSVTLLTGTDLLAPSIDRFGWVWTGERETGAGLQAVSRGGTSVPVMVDWLAGRAIESVRVSHEGARVVVVSSTDGATYIDVAAVIRDESGVPQRLSDSVTIGAGVQGASQAVWIDESTVGVLAEGASAGVSTVNVVPISGRTETLSGGDAAATIAAGRGLRSIYVATAAGDLLSRASTGATWSTIASDVQLPTFPG
ncbi:LpqB family beta-propeller domain-containing protein [Sanguibacter antarcticus]|uniref:Sporulation and spore germination protein n=1 Tax=Sanguibacter antarcticus TaxID=372484 RepID=A0A2A9E0J4_9MICO|nr:LpqB family beta-propeller domain-containing protein [Sanguibacter antarcticus]PFG32567.1 sporulation and spore germination protein [Sanguibacter antarcticus]